MSSAREIRFYNPSERYGFLSNFFVYAFYLDGRKWYTVEHYYQAQKFRGTSLEEHVRTLLRPGGAKNFAGLQAALWRPDWDTAKEEVMRSAVSAKFNQSAFLAEELLATGTAILIEDSPSDFFWGIGCDGTGRNILGKILEETRAALLLNGVDTGGSAVRCSG